MVAAEKLHVLRLLSASFGAFEPAGEREVQAEERRSLPRRWRPRRAAFEEERLLIPAMLYVEPAKLPGVEGVLESWSFNGIVDDLGELVERILS